MFLLGLIACPGGPSDTAPDDSAETCPLEDTGTQIGLIEAECACEEPWAALGTGIEGFEELPVEGLEMVHGPQGGWHLPAALRVGNTRNVVRIHAQVTDVLTGIPVTEELKYHVQLVAEEGCQGSYPNMYLYLDVDDLAPGETEAVGLSCRDVVIEMCVTDTGGREFCVEETVFVLPDPTDVASAQAPECD